MTDDPEIAHEQPDDALSIVTDAALEFAKVLDERLADPATSEADRDHFATLAMEVREAVSELDNDVT